MPRRKKKILSDVSLIDDQAFTEDAFLEDPFKWIDKETWERVNVMSVRTAMDALIEINPLDKFPTLHNGISLETGSYLLVRKREGGKTRRTSYSLVHSRACRHLILNGNKKLELAELPVHQAVLASVLSMNSRDVTVFSPMIQIEASRGLGNSQRKKFLEEMMENLDQELTASVDKYRKAFVFYYMLLVDLERYRDFRIQKQNHEILSTRKFKIAPQIRRLPADFKLFAWKQAGEFAEEHDALRENQGIEELLTKILYPKAIGDGNHKPGFQTRDWMENHRITARMKQSRHKRHVRKSKKKKRRVTG